MLRAGQELPSIAYAMLFRCVSFKFVVHKIPDAGNIPKPTPTATTTRQFSFTLELKTEPCPACHAHSFHQLVQYKKN